MIGVGGRGYSVGIDSEPRAAEAAAPDDAAAGAAGPPLLERRLCFVLGKGGAGRSTVAAALGLAVAGAGRRCLVIEVAGQEGLSRAFTSAEVGHGAATKLAPGLFGIAIDPERATEEYLAKQLRIRPLVDLLTRSRAFSQFTAAAPGLAELVTVGKIWSLATALRDDGTPVWDYLIVDCPATGHGIALLETAGNVRELAGGGPIADQAADIERVIVHPAATGIAVVARPEELPVTEAVEATQTLRAAGLPVALAVLNAGAPPRFATDEEPALRAVAETAEDPARAAVAAALRHLERQRARTGYADRLREGTGLPVLELPNLVRRRIDAEALGELAAAAAAGLNGLNGGSAATRNGRPASVPTPPT